MATEKQRKAASIISENIGKPFGEAMREAGYSESTSKTPQRLTESDGFKELCEKVGLTDDFILQALKEDIQLKPQNRVGELQLASKMKGLVIDRTDHTTKGQPMITLSSVIANKNGIDPATD